jgi:hypothetical protein
MPFDYKRSIRRLDSRVRKAWNFEINPYECGVDITGNIHDGNDPRCAHSTIDPTTMEFCCRVQNARDVETQRDENQWLSPMLKYYWRNGIRSEGFAFLKKAGFVISYRFAAYLQKGYSAKLTFAHSRLCVDTFYDAACPYGKTVNAFMLVEGWRVRYLLCLVAAVARSRQVNVIDCGSTASRVLSSGLNERLNT